MADEIHDDPVRQPFFSVELDQDDQPPALAELEKLYLRRLLELTGGNRSKVARILEVSYPTVTRKIAKYGIKVPE